MTSFGEVVRNYADKPFDLYELRGKEFTVIENIPKNQPIREMMVKGEQEWNKGKLEPKFFIKVEHGLFIKDLTIRSSELQALALAVPKTITNLAGVRLQVDKFDSKTLKFVGQTTQDLNGNKIEGANVSTPSQNPPTTQPDKPKDQRDVFLDKIVASITTLNALGNKVDTSVLIKMCESMSPGNALGLIGYAKEKGAIFEKDGSYQAVV